MAQWGQVFATKSDGLNSIPGTCMVTGENRLAKLSSGLDVCIVAQALPSPQ